jgi:hypothetical protein
VRIDGLHLISIEGEQPYKIAVQFSYSGDLRPGISAYVIPFGVNHIGITGFTRRCIVNSSVNTVSRCNRVTVTVHTLSGFQ